MPSGYAFDFLADPSTARIIDPAVREYRPDSVPMREGTRTDIRFRMWGLPVRAVSVVRCWEPGGRMVMVSERRTRPVRVVATHRFEPAGPDRCTYTWAIGLVPVGPLGPLAARLFARFMRADATASRNGSRSRSSGGGVRRGGRRPVRPRAIHTCPASAGSNVGELWTIGSGRSTRPGPMLESRTGARARTKEVT